MEGWLWWGNGEIFNLAKLTMSCTDFSEGGFLSFISDGELGDIRKGWELTPATSF